MHPQTFMPTEQFSYIHVAREEVTPAGYYTHICTLLVLELHLNVEGYLTLADDVIFNFWQPFDQSRFRLPYIWRSDRHSWMTNRNCGRPKVREVLKEIGNTVDPDLIEAVNIYKKLVKSPIEKLFLDSAWGSGDISYMPQHASYVTYHLGKLFLRHKVYHEIVVPRLALPYGFERFYWTSSEVENGMKLSEMDIKGRHFWGDGRDYIWPYHYNDENVTYLHPVKLLIYGNIKPLRREYCAVYVKTYLKALNRILSKP